MATIFTVNYSGNYGKYYEFKAEATESSASSANNTSVVTVKTYIRRTNSSPNGAWVGTGNATAWSITIDGTKTSGTSMWDTRNTTAWQLIGTASKTVTHNSDGSKNITIAATHTGLASTGITSASGSGSLNLTNIPRYATCSQSLSSKTSLNIKINWSSNSTIDYIWYSINGGTSWNAVGSVNATSGNYTISGLSSNTTYTIKTRVRRKDSQLTTDSSVLSVATYPKTIPTIALSKKTVNTITVTSNCNVTASSTQYRIKTTSGSYGAYQTSATFSSLNPNTAYIVEVRKVGSASGEAGVATLSVTTYQVALLTSASNFNLGDTKIITYSNPSGATINVGIYTNDGSASYAAYRVASGTSYKFTFTDAELDKLYKAYKKENTITARIYLRTTANNVNYWDYKTITITLKGNQKTGHINISGVWKRSKQWINIQGSYKRCVSWINVNGNWRRCI